MFLDSNTLNLAVEAARILPATIPASRIGRDVYAIATAADAHKTNMEMEYTIGTAADHELFMRQRRDYERQAKATVTRWNIEMQAVKPLAVGDGWTQRWSIDMGAMSFNLVYTNEKGQPHTYYLTNTGGE